MSLNANPETLLERVKADGDESSAHSLLQAFFAGYPIERLRELLQSTNEATVRSGAWLASELGSRVAPLLGDLNLLLGHSSRYVRFFALDGVLAGASVRDGAVVSRALRLLHDPDGAVRWKAANFAARASGEQLAAAARFLDQPELATNLKWLLAQDDDIDRAGLVARLHSSERLMRVFAWAAAARQARHDRTLLEEAMLSEDAEISSLAREWLGFDEPPDASARRE